MNEEAPTDDVPTEDVKRFLEVLKNRPQDAMVCYTKCWSCQFGDHDKTWHTWADDEDVAHALSSNRPDPSNQRCGCYCQKEKP